MNLSFTGTKEGLMEYLKFVEWDEAEEVENDDKWTDRYDYDENGEPNE